MYIVINYKGESDYINEREYYLLNEVDEVKLKSFFENQNNYLEKFKPYGMRDIPYFRRVIDLYNNIQNYSVNGKSIREVFQWDGFNVFQFLTEQFVPGFKTDMDRLIPLVELISIAIEKGEESIVVVGNFNEFEHKTIQQINKVKAINIQAIQFPITEKPNETSVGNRKFPKDLLIKSTRALEDYRGRALVCTYPKNEMTNIKGEKYENFFHSFAPFFEKKALNPLRFILEGYEVHSQNIDNSYTKEDYLAQGSFEDQIFKDVLFADHPMFDTNVPNLEEVRLKFLKSLEELVKDPGFIKLFDWSEINLFAVCSDLWVNLFVNHLTSAVVKIDKMKKVLNVLQPSAIFTPLETGSFQRAIIGLANRLNIPTFGLQHGQFYDYHYYYNLNNTSYQDALKQVIPRVTFVWGDSHKEKLTVNNDYPENSVVTVGDWRVFNNDFKLNTDTQFNDNGKKRVVLITHPIYPDNLVDNLCKVFPQDEWEFIFKPHLIERMPSQFLDNVIEKGYQTYPSSGYLHHDIQNADLVVVAIGSSAVYEALFHQKPTIYYRATEVMSENEKALGEYLPNLEDLENVNEANLTSEVTCEVNRVINHAGYAPSELEMFTDKVSEAWDQVVTPKKRNPAAKKNTVIYSAIIGDYDIIPQPRYVQDNCDYVLITDQEFENPGVWKIQKPVKQLQDNTRTARWHKLNPHLIFNEYEHSIWIDSNITIQTDYLENRINELIELKTKIAVVQHMDRDCIYEEANICVQLGKDEADVVSKTMQFLESEKFPRKNGLIESNIIFRQHHHPEIVELDQLWWRMLNGFSRRDQLTLNYCFWKLNQTYSYLFKEEGFSARNHPGFDLIINHSQNGTFRNDDEKKKKAIEYKNIANLYTQYNRPNRAIEMAKSSVDLYPSSEGYVTLGNTLFNIGEISKSIEAFEEALSITPNNEMILKNVAFLKTLVPKKQERSSQKKVKKFGRSALADKLLKNKVGLEIGGSAHNSFELDTLNIDYTKEITHFKKQEIEMCGESLPVDIVSPDGLLPFKDKTQDFVINSHVLQYFWDPISAINEWLRVIKEDGYLFMILPHFDRTSNGTNTLSDSDELIERFHDEIPVPDSSLIKQWCFWNPQSFLEMCQKAKLNVVHYQDVDDKVGNGFTFIIQKKRTKFKTSALANKYLKDLTGVEIGGSAHNSFDLDTLNVDYTKELTRFKKYEVSLCGEYTPVDIVSTDGTLPFKDNTQDFVINSHVVEHFWDPVGAIKEWLRVIKPHGYLFMIIPHKERTHDKDREITYAQEILDRHSGVIKIPHEDDHHHWSVWDTNSFLDLCNKAGFNVVEYQDVDDKVGNGFTIVIQKEV